MLEEDFKQEGVLLDENLSDDDLNKVLEESMKENLGIIDEEKKGDEETPPESSPEKKPTEKPPASQGGEGDDKEEEKQKKEEEEKPNTDDENKKDTPFHEHPRFKKLYREKKELESNVKTLEERLQKLENPPKEEKLPPIPSWFAGDEEAWKEYNDEQKEKEKALINKVLDESGVSSKKKEEEIVKKNNEWINEKLEEMEEDPDIPKFNKNELIKFMLDNPIVDENNYPDFRKGLDLMNKLNEKKIKEKENEKKKETDAKKKLMSTDGTAGGDNNDGDKVVTADDIRHRAFTDF